MWPGLLIFPLFSVVIIPACRGQLSTNDGCYQFYPYSRLTCAKEFERRTGITEEKCQELCNRYAACAGLNYRAELQQCDLFPSAVKGVGDPVSTNIIQKTRRTKIARRRRQSYLLPNSYQTAAPRYHGYYATAAIVYEQTTPAYRVAGPPQSKCDGYGPTLFPSQQFNFYKSTGKCFNTGISTALATQPTVATVLTGSNLSTVCSPGNTAAFGSTRTWAMVGFSDTTFPATSAVICAAACKDNKTPTGTPAPCASAQFNSATQTCTISSNAIKPKGTGNLTLNDNVVYLEKMCISDSLAQTCPGPYRIEAQRILVGYARQVASAPTVTDCVSLCLMAQSRYSFQCNSATYYLNSSTTDNCILNSETAKTQPESYVNPDLGDQTNYIDPGCPAVARQRLHRRLILRQTPPSGSMLKVNSTEWAEWGACDRRQDTRIRFRNCSTFNPKTCEGRQQTGCGVEKSDRLIAPGDDKLTTPPVPPQLPKVVKLSEASESSCQPVLTADGAVNCALPGNLAASNGQPAKCVPDICV